MALQRGKHHVSGVKRVNEIGWEGCILLLFIDWLIIKTFNNGEILYNCSDDVLLRVWLVRLDTREAKRCNPFYRFTSTCNDFSTFREPFLDIVSITEQISDTFNCDFCKILRGFVKLTVSFIETLILKLSLNLFTSTDESDTIHRCHHSLLNDLSSNIALQTFCNL